MKNKIIIKSILSLSLTFGVLIIAFITWGFISFGWFSNNKEVTTTGMNISIDLDDTIATYVVYKFDTVTNAASSIEQTETTPVANLITNLEMLHHDTVFKERNAYTPIVVKINVRGVKINPSGGTIAIRIERTTEYDDYSFVIGGTTYYLDASNNIYTVINENSIDKCSYLTMTDLGSGVKSFSANSTTYYLYDGKIYTNQAHTAGEIVPTQVASDSFEVLPETTTSVIELAGLADKNYQKFTYNAVDYFIYSHGIYYISGGNVTPLATGSDANGSYYSPDSGTTKFYVTDNTSYFDGLFLDNNQVVIGEVYTLSGSTKNYLFKEADLWNTLVHTDDEHFNDDSVTKTTFVTIDEAISKADMITINVSYSASDVVTVVENGMDINELDVYLYIGYCEDPLVNMFAGSHPQKGTFGDSIASDLLNDLVSIECKHSD